MSELTLDSTLLSELATQNQEQLHSHQNQKDAIQISWAQNDNEIKEAQQLRYKVFAEEMGAHLPSDKAKSIFFMTISVAPSRDPWNQIAENCCSPCISATACAVLSG
mgnify:CR=1 FL=1